eukprot:CAMPEP_0172511658 /NCGR_PEP_ID=MMETSP1066-20121228/237980_1 /TAXON_ID=671091 /ORGANISM="Coscinodiscus wailesii, Strain CCMP2513" /LENGTH=498 /DNA_ID=CAMNT_0013291125 /DNA_START=84 /DNA_END=1580 /DNA_ORIENTATION=-
MPAALTTIIKLNIFVGLARTTRSQEQCSLYLAPSTSTCHARSSRSSCLGLYAGTAYPAGTDLVPPGGINFDVPLDVLLGYNYDSFFYSDDGSGGGGDSLVPVVGFLPPPPGGGSGSSSSVTLKNTHRTLNSVHTTKNKGAVSKRGEMSLRTVRDVMPGEKLYLRSDGGDDDDSGGGAEQCLAANCPALEGRENVEHLRSVGYCLDGLTVGVSKIPDAGRGAFASVPFGQGSVVAPVAVIPFLREDLETRYENPVYELLLNYCMGHMGSKLVLFPVTPIVNYINHRRSSSPGSGPNVELRFPNNGKSGSGSWGVDSSIEDIMKDRSPVILYELVATRDIAPGDEIVMDYGQAWDRSWKKYSKKMDDFDDFSSAAAWNAQKTAGEPLDEDQDVYPLNLMLECFVDMDDTYQKTMTWKLTADLYQAKNLYSCEILDSAQTENGSYVYTMRVNTYDDAVTKVRRVPQDAIWFVEDSINPRDIFRYYIDIPETLFPSQWTGIE